MNNDQNEPGSSHMDHSIIEEQLNSDRRRNEQRNRKGSRGTCRGYKRRGGERSVRSKRWRGSGGPEGLPFLHGGNINDPLNLESVQPEEEGGQEGFEPLEILIPKNPRDPLNLKKIIKNRNKRKRRNSKLYGEDATGTTIEGTSAQTAASTEERPVFDPIVSPVPASVVRKFNYKQSTQKQKSAGPIDQSEKKKILEDAKKKERSQSLDYSKDPDENSGSQPPNEKKAKMNENNYFVLLNYLWTKQFDTFRTFILLTLGNELLFTKVCESRFRYGNFDRYYGCRIERSHGKDPRLFAFKKEWFEKKSVLDIGCNAGYITLWIAKEYAPRRILGIDIDPHLVGVARKNIRHYCDKSIQIEGSFPASFVHRYGPVSAPPVTFSSKFPDNVWFRQENYVLEYDEFLETVKEEFDVILALSITKWIHLNWGDDGLKRFFRRAFLHLRPGGKLILEPQDFKSYYKRARMTAETLEIFKTLKFLPESFQEFLLNEVGFQSCENLDVPKAKTKGFDRPIQIYKKKASFFSQLHPKDSEKKPGVPAVYQESDMSKEKDGVSSPKRPKLIKFED